MSWKEYADLSPTFAKACRAADEAARKKPRDPALERLRVLLDDTVSFEEAYGVFDAERRKYGAASSTIEALMWSLRQGTDALIEPDTRRRLSELNDKQLVAVGERLERFKPHIAEPWSPESIEQLVKTWKAVRR